MTGKRKVFSQGLCDDNDPKSRDVVKFFYRNNGLAVLINNPNKFDTDLVSEDGKFLVEVERKPGWVVKWPYPVVNILERKYEKLKKGNTTLVYVSFHYNQLGIISGKNLSPHLIPKNLQEVPNTQIGNGEMMYRLPNEIMKIFPMSYLHEHKAKQKVYFE